MFPFYLFDEYSQSKKLAIEKKDKLDLDPHKQKIYNNYSLFILFAFIINSSQSYSQVRNFIDLVYINLSLPITI